jgi:predicted ATP-grasp superfamily ATP-dependent carboligase/protein-S-isoprenylcysteine O-methyltransferase Ste14
MKPLSTLTALVLDAHDSHSLSAIRSLGGQGATVTGVSPKPQAMGAVSRYCHRTLRSPNPGTEPGAYAEWLLATLAREPFSALLFFGEASANVIAEHRDAIRALTGCLVSDHDTFLTADRKDRVIRLASAIGVPVPATHELARFDDAEVLSQRLTFPVIVKGVAGSGGHQVRFARTPELFVEFVRQVATATADGAPQRCLVQEYVPGVGYGYTALAEHGEVVAAFMHRRLAEHDVVRGAQLAHAATGAESVDEPELRSNGVALLRALRWDGMAMVEFRRSHRDQRFYLMEVNPRFPGSLALAIAAGVDFPSLYVQRAVGRPVSGPERYRIGLRYRWLVSKGFVEAVENPLGYVGSVASVLRPDTRCDVSLHDPRPHFVQMREAAWWLQQYVRGRTPRFRRRGWPMALREGFGRAEAWLLRRRGYVLVAFVAATLVAMQGFTYPRGDHRLDLAWEGVCLLVGLVGLAVRAATVGLAAHDTFERNANARAAESLDPTGTYSVMRHPLYFGTLLMWLGISAFPRTWWPPALAIVAFWLYYGRIMHAEDEARRRRFGRSYGAWAAVTPAFLPRLSLWRRPRGEFALRRVLRSEPKALFALVACLTLLELIGEVNITSHVTIDAEWASLFTTTAVAYATLSVVKQRMQPRS